MKRTTMQLAIMSGIKKYTGIQPYRSNQGLDVPDNPHVVFSYLIARGVLEGGDIIIYEPGDQKLTRHNVRDITRTFSFTAVADDDSTAFELAEELHKCFTDYMATDLMYAGIAIEMLTDVQPRTAIDEDIEGRAGFDVRLRAAEVVDIDIDYIEEIRGGITIGRT